MERVTTTVLHKKEYEDLMNIKRQQDELRNKRSLRLNIGTGLFTRYHMCIIKPKSIFHLLNIMVINTSITTPQLGNSSKPWLRLKLFLFLYNSDLKYNYYTSVIKTHGEL